MKIPLNRVKQLREQTGLSITECKKALEEAKGDIEKALKVLREKGGDFALKRLHREAKEGIIESYIHSDGKIGVILELNCETDFVARSKEFKELAHDLAMHIAAMNPRYISLEEIPKEVIQAEKEIYLKQFSDSGKPERVVNQIVEGKIEKYSEEISLLTQPFVKNPDITVKELIEEYIGKLGENIKVGRFTRYEI